MIAKMKSGRLQQHPPHARRSQRRSDMRQVMVNILLRENLLPSFSSPHQTLRGRILLQMKLQTSWHPLLILPQWAHPHLCHPQKVIRTYMHAQRLHTLRTGYTHSLSRSRSRSLSLSQATHTHRLYNTHTHTHTGYTHTHTHTHTQHTNTTHFA